ncbi:MAG: SsrA-binding protein SmpB [Acidobacteria bacterium]|nr:SsrA-binding protein SmpB [Acidobacteriota bacterium]
MKPSNTHRTGEKTVSLNRQAFHQYHISDVFEAGMALRGTEVKSIRAGRVNLKDGYGAVKGGEVWLLNCHISPYEQGNRMNHQPLRPRKLLLHRREIRKLIGQTSERGMTLVPLRIYFHKGRAKCEIALAKGKKLFDKREKEKRKTMEREARQAMKQRDVG